MLSVNKTIIKLSSKFKLAFRGEEIFAKDIRQLLVCLKIEISAFLWYKEFQSI